MSIAVICPGAMSYDAGSPDQTFRDLTLFFGLYSMNTFFSDPDAGTLPDTVNRTGRGRPGAYCQRSGNYFPQERLRIDGDGRLVGDLFYTTGTPTPGEQDNDLWPGDY
jgi:hypothetical protein